MKALSVSLRTVNELIRSGQFEEAIHQVVNLKQSRPALAFLYDNKLEEIRRFQRVLGQDLSPVVKDRSDATATNSASLGLGQIVFVTATCTENDRKRLAIEATWGENLRRKGVRHYFIIGVPALDAAYRLNQTIYVPCRDDYESLLLKLALAYEYLLSHECSFTHIFKIDDDCYVNLPKLEQDLQQAELGWDYIAGAIQPQEERINCGWHFGKCSDTRFDTPYPHDYPPTSYAKGGYGYFLSRKAMEIVVREINVFARELVNFIYAYEDLRIGQILYHAGVFPRNLASYVVARPNSPSTVNSSVVVDISDAAEFFRYHHEIALQALKNGNPAELCLAAYAEDSFTKEKLGFDHVYVVNLRSAIDRRSSVQWTLDQAGISYELIPAFDGLSDIGKRIFEFIQQREVGELQTHPQYSALEKRRGKKFIDTHGAVGYVLTYVRILQDAKRKGFKNILILEDDVFLRCDFKAHLARFMDKVSAGYKILMLGASQYGWGCVDVAEAEKKGHYQATALDTCGSFAIAINLSIADELIDELLTFDGPFDHIPLGQIYERYPDQCHVAFPNLVIPDVSDSYIREGRDQLSHSLKMRWRLGDFVYPRRRARIGLVLCGNAVLRSPAPADLGIDIFCYRVTEDGLRPVHSQAAACPNHREIQRVQEEQCFERSHALPVDALFATTRSSDGAEVAIEVLDAPRRFGAQDGRSREWLRPLNNKAYRTSKDLATVIIPTRGRSQSLVMSVKSALDQDYPHKEVIVVDENESGSVEAKFVSDLVDVWKKTGAPIRLIRHARPRNAAAARNTGLLATKAEFVSFLDDDDSYLPGRLSRVIAVLKSSSASTGAAYCGYLGWGSKVSDSSRYPTNAIPRRLLNLEFKSHYVCTDTVTYRREALLSVNGYDESFRRHQDLELNIRVFRDWEIAVHSEALVQLNPLPPDNSNKLYDLDLFDVKMRFLSNFQADMEKLSLDVNAIFSAHVKEMVHFTNDKNTVQEFALKHPSRFSSHYLASVLAEHP